MSSEPDALLADWCDLMARGGSSDPEAVAGAGRRLLAAWAEPHRRYHTVEHLAAVLGYLDLLATGDDDAGWASRTAGWFHDAVYEPGRPDNEAASAVLARAELSGLGLASGSIAEIERLVQLTATHQSQPDDRAGALLCDADLAVLGQPAPAYERYVTLVRAEYASVDEVAWRAGRLAVLRPFFDRPAIYATAEGRRRWEDQARTNLAGEIEQLAAG